MFEVSTASSNTSLQSLGEVFNRFVDRSLWQVVPDNLKRLLEFSDCLRLCFKLAISFQHCAPHMVVISGEFGGHWSLVMKSGQLVRSQFCALRGVARYACAHAPSCWKMNPVGSRRLL